MKNTRLIKLLATFSKNEMREFSDYVDSPFYNKNRNVVNLFKIVSVYYPGFDSKQFLEEKLFKKLFKGEEYDYFKLKNIVSDLYRLGMDYLRLKYTGNTFDSDVTYIMELRQRKLLNQYESEYKKIFKKHSDTLIKDDEYYLNDVKMSAEKSYYNFLLKPNTGFNLAQDQLNSLLNFTLIRFLKLYTLMIYEMKQNNVEYDLKFLDEIKKYIIKHDEEKNPTFQLYKHILLLEVNRKEEDYFKIKEIHSNHIVELSEKDRYMSYIHRGGYCAYVFNILGEKSFLGEMLEVHKGMLSEGFYDNIKMPYPDFVNFVKIGTLNDEDTYVSDFIKRFKDELPDDEKENCLNYSEAYIAFHKNDKSKALELLSRTNFSNFILKIQVKILQIQIYSELGMHDQLLAAIDTCRHYLRSEGFITEQYKKTIANFLILVNDPTLIKADPIRNKDGFNEKELQKKVKKLSSNVFGIKMWLESQLEKVL